MANTATDLYLKRLRQKYKEKGATEQEAETMASQDQAQQEAQQSKYDTLNGWQKFGAGVEEFVDNMAQTFLDLGEGLVDSVAIAAGSIAEGTGNKDTANNIRGWVERDWTDELVNQGNAFGTGFDLWSFLNTPSNVLWGKETREASRQEDLLPDVVDSISSGIGSSLGMGALSSIPYVGWFLTGMAAGGASAEQELKNNPDIDITSAMGYGVLNGSVEVASELLVGKFLGLLGKGVNKAFGGSAVSETATRFGLGSSTGGNIVTNLLKEFNEEGIEEVVSEFVDPIARKLTIEKDKSWGDTLGDTWGSGEYWINDVWTAYWQGGLSSVVMGGAGATANTIKAGGVKNYNAILQVKQVAEINEQIKELEAKNTNGMYDSKIQALNAQKQNVINNFQKNFEQFVQDYLKDQNGDTLTKKEERRASIYDSLEYESNRDVRRELAAETAFKAGAFDVTFDKDGKPSYAIKKDNFINYDGKQLSAKDWVTSVIHEIGHINVNDFSFVDSILQDVSAQELQKLENEYTERYKRAYTATSVMASDYYKEEIKNVATQEQAIENARKKMIKEEIAMDRFASYFDNIDEFKRAINGKKLSLLERLKERFMNTYKHVEKAQKPKNYDSIIKALREAVEQTKERRTKLFVDSMNGNAKKSNGSEDKRYRITSQTDNEGKPLSEEQVEMFKNSKVRDENGNLLRVYHTSEYSGFTEFDGSKAIELTGVDASYKYKGFNDYTVTFFTSDRDMSASYGRNKDRFVPPYVERIKELKEKNPEKYEEYKKELNSIGKETKTKKMKKEMKQMATWSLSDEFEDLTFERAVVSKIRQDLETYWETNGSVESEFLSELTKELNLTFTSEEDLSPFLDKDGYDVSEYDDIILNSNAVKKAIPEESLVRDRVSAFEADIYSLNDMLNTKMEWKEIDASKFLYEFNGKEYNLLSDFEDLENDFIKSIRDKIENLSDEETEKAFKNFGLVEELSEKGQVYETYLNIKKPFEIDAHGSLWNEINFPLGYFYKKDKYSGEFLYSSEFRKMLETKQKLSINEYNSMVKELVDNNALDNVYNYTGKELKCLEQYIKLYFDSDFNLEESYVNNKISIMRTHILRGDIYTIFDETDKTGKFLYEVIHMPHNKIYDGNKFIETDVWVHRKDFTGINTGFEEVKDLMQKNSNTPFVNENSEIYLGSLGTNSDNSSNITPENLISTLKNGEQFSHSKTTTNGVVKYALNQNKVVGKDYDGVIIKNVIDYGGGQDVENYEPHDLYISFHKNQIKDIDNLMPTEENPDIRYRITDTNWDEIEKANKPEYTERYGKDIDFRYAFSIVDPFREDLQTIDKNNSFDDLEKAEKANMAIQFLEAYRDFAETIDQERESAKEDFEEAINNNDLEAAEEAYNHYYTLSKIGETLEEEYQYYYEEVDREKDYDNCVGIIAKYNEEKIEKADGIIDEIDGYNVKEFDDLQDFKEKLEELKGGSKNTEETATTEVKAETKPLNGQDYTDQSPLSENQIAQLTKIRNSSKLNKLRTDAANLNMEQNVAVLKMISEKLIKIEDIKKGEYKQILHFLNTIDNEIQMAKGNAQTTSNEEKAKNVENAQEQTTTEAKEADSIKPTTRAYLVKQATAFLKIVDETRIDELNAIIKQMNETTSLDELKKLNDEVEKMKQEQKEKANEQNIQGPNETGTGTVQQGVSGDNGEVSKGSTGSENISQPESKSEGTILGDAVRNDNSVGQEVGVEPGTSDRLYRGSREWDRISDTKNGYNSKLRRTSNKGRGRDRILNLYRYGEFIRENINIATTPTSINGQTYSVIKDEALPEFLLDMRKEFQKVSTAKGLNIYFFVSDANDTRNGFAVEDEIITVRLDSSATNTALHELSHILSKMVSNSYKKASNLLFNDYFVKNQKEYNELYEPIKNIYEKKYKPRFIKEYGVNSYEKLSEIQQKSVDNKVKDLLNEELFCAIIQGKTKIQDRSFHNKLINDYLADIKTEYGADLAQYYYNGFINADEIEVKPEDIKMSKYSPVEIINPTPTNKKTGLETYSQYLERMKKLVTSFRDKIDTLESMTDFNKILPSYELLKDYKLNISRTLRDLKNYKIEWENVYKADFEILAAKYEEIKNLFIEYAEKFETKKDENGKKLPNLLDTLSAKVDKLKIIEQYNKEKKELLNYLSKNRLSGNEKFLNEAQNLAEIIETRYNTAIENATNFYDNKIYEQIKKSIDTLWNNFASENERISELLKKGEFIEDKQRQTEKKIKKRLNRGELTYSVEDEAKRLKELKENLKPNLKEIQDVVHAYSALIKSAKSKYLKYNLDPSAVDETHRPLGMKAKINLHEKLVKYINDLTSKIADYRMLAEEFTKDETFRKANLYKEIYETVTTLENKIGTALDGNPEETLYGLKNALYVDIVKYSNSNKKYAEIVSKQSASAKKDIKDAIKDIERNIPNEANDLIDELEDLKEKYQELLTASQDQIEINNELQQQIADLEEKIEKIKIQKDKQIKSKQNSVEYWKAKYANGTATIKDLKQERDKYKKELLESQKEINLKQEVNDFDKKYSKLEKELREQKEINENVKKELKEKKAEYNKKVAESKTLTKKIVELRKKLFFEKVNNKSMLKVDNNFIDFMNEFVKAFQQDIKYTDDFFDMNTLQKLALAVTENNSQAFADALITGLEAKGFDKELLALENGEHLYYESNFSDLVELAFIELNNYQNSEFTNLGKLMVRLENAKTDYKLLQERYNANFRIRTAATSVKSFNKFFNENTKNTSSRLNGVDTNYREALVKFVKVLQDYTSIEAVASGALRRKILDFYKELRMSYENDIEVNGIALDDGLISIFEELKKYEAEYQEYIQDLENSSLSATESATSEEETKKAKPKNSYKISEEEAKLYRSLFKGLKRFTDDVMHNRYWEIGDFNGTGTEFTEKIVNETRDLKYVIKHLRWNPLTKMYMSPRNIFREISGYKENAMIMEMFKELEKGTIRTMEAKMALAKPLQEFFKKNKKFEKELQKDSEKYRHTIKYGDKSISASTTLLLDLYEAMQNENNKKHLMNDGFELGNAQPRRFEDGELKQLEEAIVKEFKLNDENSIYSQYIKLLNNMYELAKKYKIETDIRMRGFTNVDDGFYYPTNVSDFNLDIDLSKSAYNLGNSYGGVDLVTNQRSFNIDRTSTRGAIRIVNSYDKMLQHINGMASYYGVDTAILNFSKMYRYRVEGGISGGNAIRQLYGQDYRKFDRYLGELFKDMRGTNTPTTGTDLFFKKVESFIRGGVVTASLVNPKVIATQPASLITAFKYINPKHILSSLHRGFVLTSKYPPLPTVGAYRYFDQSALQAETGGVSGIQKQIGKGISAGDHFAINIEWAACCKQVGLLQFEKGTAQYEEALQKATELFTRVVNDTQPNNSPLGKAEIMRSDNEIIKLLTMYRSQAMQHFNILYDSINQLRMLSKMAKAQHLSYQETKVMLAKPKKDLARALASLILEGALFTFIGQLFAHFVNNDWDEEDFWANATRDFSIEYFNDNVLGIMPVLNKLSLEYEKKLSISMDNITMGWVESVIESLQKMSDGASPKEFIKVVSYGTGIPISTNYKYTKAIVQYFSPEFATEFDAIYNGTNTRSKKVITDALNNNQSAKAYKLYKKYTSYSMEFDMQTTKELFDLYKEGYKDTAVKQIPASISYNGQKIKVDEKQFKDIYSKVAKHINRLTKSSTYKQMPKDERAKTIKYLLDMYYSLAKKNITGQELSFVERVLLYDANLSVDKILLIKSIKDIEADKKLSKKEKTQLYIDKLKTPKAYKYFLYMASGYSLNDEQKKLVKGYLINNGLSWKKATEVLQ